MAVPSAESNPRHAHINCNQIHRQFPLQTQLYTRAFLRMMKAMMSPPDHTRSSDARLALILSLVGFALSAAFAIASPHGLHHFDDLTHYLYARWAWTWPAYLLDHWGRPGFTVLYAPSAALGWTACRILSALLSAATGWFAFRIAQHAGLRHAWAATLFTSLQPLFFQLAQTTLTETPLAFYLTGALLLALRDRWRFSAAILSLCFITRHEAILFLPIWAFFIHRRKVSLWRLWPALWAPVVVNTALWLAGSTTIVALYLEPRPSTQYGHDVWYTFFVRSLHAWGPGVSIMTWTGLVLFFTGRPRRSADACEKVAAGQSDNSADTDADGVPGRSSRDTDARFAFEFLSACIVGYFAAQSVIRAFGLFGSGGYARFLVPVGPLVSVAALAGWNSLVSRNDAERRRAGLIAPVIYLALLIAFEFQIRYPEGMDIEFPFLWHAKMALRISCACLLAAAVAARILDRDAGENSKPRRRVIPVLPATLALMLGSTAYVFVRPLQPPPQAPIIQEALTQLDELGLSGRPIVSANVWMEYVTNQSHSPEAGDARSRLQSAPVGALFAWEKQFAASQDHNLPLDDLFQNTSFRFVLKTGPRPFHAEPYLYIFEKIKPWTSSPQTH